MRIQLLNVVLMLLMVACDAHAQSPPSPTPPLASIAPNQQDLNKDGFIDEIIADPFWNENRGRVTLFSSLHPNCSIELQGVSPDDYFGWSTCLVPDSNHSAGIILAIGILGGDATGVVALYELRQIQWGKNIGVVALPKKYIRPTIDTDRWFGFDLAPCFDFDGYGLADMRIASSFLQSGTETTRTYIFDAVIGVPVAYITPESTTNTSVLRPKSDSTVNGLVDEEDLLLIIGQLGTTPSTLLTGDINGDSKTDGEDLVQVLGDLGNSLFVQNNEVVCSGNEGCGTEGVMLDSCPACVTWLHCNSIGAFFGTDPEDGTFKIHIPTW